MKLETLSVTVQVVQKKKGKSTRDEKLEVKSIG